MDRTNAERQARWQKKRAAEFAALKARVAELEAGAALHNGPGLATGDAKYTARITELEAEVARLKAEIAEWAGAGRPPPLPRTREELLAAKARAAAERQAKRAAAKAAKLAAEAQAAPDEKSQLEIIVELREKLAREKTISKNLRAENRAASALLHEARQGQYCPPELHKQIQACLHPDWVSDPKQRRRYEKTLQGFNEHFGNRRK